MTATNRLVTPLPDSVLDRYYTEHPDEVDFRRPRPTGALHDGTQTSLDIDAPSLRGTRKDTDPVGADG